MPTSRLPLDIKNFLNESIDSVTHLEILLMLYSRPETVFDAGVISKELRTNNRSVEVHLERLFDKGLLFKNESKQYQYKPKSEQLHETVRAVDLLYKEKPVAIVTCIFEKPQDKLKDFSDAFRLKKD